MTDITDERVYQIVSASISHSFTLSPEQERMLSAYRQLLIERRSRWIPVGEPELNTSANLGDEPYPKCTVCGHDFHGLPCESCGCERPWEAMHR